MITCTVSLIKFTYFDSCLVFFDFDILYLIKEKNIFDLSVWFLNCIFDFQNFRVWFFQYMFDCQNEVVWFLKWHFWFPKLVSFDSFDFQNLSRLIYQMAFLISETWLVWFFKWLACVAGVERSRPGRKGKREGDWGERGSSLPFPLFRSFLPPPPLFAPATQAIKWHFLFSTWDWYGSYPRDIFCGW